MSIILKGIDLPFGGYFEKVEIIFHRVGGWDHRRYVFANKSLDLIMQIPKPHGRLIDGDELMERMKRDNPQTSKTKWKQILAKNAPTILEAEEQK